MDKTEIFELGLEYSNLSMDFQHLLIKVMETEDISKNPLVVEVSNSVIQCEEERGRSDKKVTEPIGHGIDRGIAIDRGGVDFGDNGFSVWPVLGG